MVGLITGSIKRFYFNISHIYFNKEVTGALKEAASINKPEKVMSTIISSGKNQQSVNNCNSNVCNDKETKDKMLRMATRRDYAGVCEMLNNGFKPNVTYVLSDTQENTESSCTLLDIVAQDKAMVKLLRAFGAKTQEELNMKFVESLINQLPVNNCNSNVCNDKETKDKMLRMATRRDYAGVCEMLNNGFKPNVTYVLSDTQENTESSCTLLDIVAQDKAMVKLLRAFGAKTQEELNMSRVEVLLNIEII